MSEPINRPEYEEALKRLEAEDSRQNHRLEKLEDTVVQINELTTSVGKLALNVEAMTKELTAQGKRMATQDERLSNRLETLENRDGELWRSIVKYALTAAIGVFIGYLFKSIGIF